MNWLGDHNHGWSPGINEGLIHRVVVTTSDRTVAVGDDGTPLLLSVDDPLISAHELHVAGTLNGVTYYGVRCPEIADLNYEGLRPVLVQLDSEGFIPVSAAMQVLDFMGEHRF